MVFYCSDSDNYYYKETRKGVGVKLYKMLCEALQPNISRKECPYIGKCDYFTKQCHGSVEQYSSCEYNQMTPQKGDRNEEEEDGQEEKQEAGQQEGEGAVDLGDS
jgi:hypothetical protein